MPNNTVVDLAIGMIAFFLLASLLVTAAQEWIAQLLDLRARTLRAAIAKMLDGDDKTAAPTKDFFDNPLIASLNTRGETTGPSYIPRDIFTRVVREAQALQGTADAVNEAVEKLPEDGSQLQQVLKGLAKNVNDLGPGLDKAVGDWFDAVMERVSGLYKRKMQAIALGLGLFVAAAMNLNAIAVGAYLATNGPARKAIADSATAAVQTRNFDVEKEEDRKALMKIMSELGTDLKLPIGWQPPAKPGAWHETMQHYLSQIAAEGIGKGAILGWFLTALATTLGSAFWFDLLKRFVNIRAAGPRPAAGTRSSPQESWP